MKEFLSGHLDHLSAQSLRRRKIVLENASAREITFKGKKLLNFSSNDYLGLSKDPRVIQSAENALRRYGAGSRSSRMISGSLEIHEELERRLAEFRGAESCLVFPSGFMTNLGVLSALLNEGDAVIMDRLDHASIIDAARLSRARVFVYEHCSPSSLDKVLHRTRDYRNRLVVTDTLFSMDGDFAPLSQIADLCKSHGAWLMADDAHAVGVFGKNGSGMAEHFGLTGKIDILVGTLSKAFGSQGGFVCGSHELMDYLLNRARPFIYTTALAPSACAAALTALEIIQQEPARRTALLALSANLHSVMKESFRENCFPQGNLLSQIVPFRVGPADRAVQWAQSLLENNIFAPAIRPPTVPKHQSRLRFSLTSEHKPEDIEQLIQSLKIICAPADNPA